MELLIRSQDRECLMKVDRLDYDLLNGEHSIMVNCYQTLVAKYDTKEINTLRNENKRLNNIIDKKEQLLGDNIKRLEREVVKRDNIINELEKWLKYKKEQMEEFELYKRKETGAFWYSTMGNIETFIERIQELKGSDEE